MSQRLLAALVESGFQSDQRRAAVCNSKSSFSFSVRASMRSSCVSVRRSWANAACLSRSCFSRARTSVLVVVMLPI
jgi:hypothetical protein